MRETKTLRNHLNKYIFAKTAYLFTVIFSIYLIYQTSLVYCLQMRNTKTQRSDLNKLILFPRMLNSLATFIFSFFTHSFNFNVASFFYFLKMRRSNMWAMRNGLNKWTFKEINYLFCYPFSLPFHYSLSSLLFFHIFGLHSFIPVRCGIQCSSPVCCPVFLHLTILWQQRFLLLPCDLVYTYLFFSHSLLSLYSLSSTLNTFLFFSSSP